MFFFVFASDGVDGDGVGRRRRMDVVVNVFEIAFLLDFPVAFSGIAKILAHCPVGA